METKICVFNENPITFALDKDNGMMVNATEMAKPFGKKVSEFMSNESTKAFVNETFKKRGFPLFKGFFTIGSLLLYAQNRYMDASRSRYQICCMVEPRS